MNRKRIYIIVFVLAFIGALIYAGRSQIAAYFGPGVVSDVYEGEVVALENRYLSPATNQIPQYFIHYDYEGTRSAIEVTYQIFLQAYVGEKVRIQGDSLGLYKTYTDITASN